MISPVNSISEELTSSFPVQMLVRYGLIPQVARYALPSETSDVIDRGSRVIIETDRGLELGHVLEAVHNTLADGHDVSGRIVRVASADDEAAAAQNEIAAADAFPDWEQRIAEWKLELQLVDLELSLDRVRTILYVLNDRGAETTRLALLAAAAGLGIISVQPVTAEGVVVEPSGGGGGCGSGSGGCGCSAS